jgi:hypothetical protein
MLTLFGLMLSLRLDRSEMNKSHVPFFRFEVSSRFSPRVSTLFALATPIQNITFLFVHGF